MRPKITVIIPAYNAEKTIKKTLDAVLSQDLSKNRFEIIVVNDGSTDNTKKIVSKFKKVKLVSIKHSGPAVARNRGAKVAKGEIIAFTDADCVPKNDWLKNLISPFKKSETVGVAGTYETLNKNQFMARFIGYEIEQRHESMKKLASIDFVGTYNCAYRKSIFRKIYGFDESFLVASGEDPELSFRMKKAGHKIVFRPKAIVLHSHPDTLKKYLKQKYNRAFWKVFLYKRHPKKVFGDVYTPKTLLPQIFFTGLALLSLLLTFVYSWIIYFFLIFILLSLFMNYNFYRFVLKKERSILLFSPIIFLLRNIISLIAILHGILFFGMKISKQDTLKIKN